jgi:hypothetical protein
MWNVALVLILLHGVDGREIDVALDEITSLHCKLPDKENKMFVDGVNAIVNLTDGKYVSVRETCGEVRDIIKNAQEIKQ